MILYHISELDCKKFGDSFTMTPRIPEQRAHLEDNSIPRICFSKSLELAMTASPLEYEDIVRDMDVPCLVVIKIDTDKYNIAADDIVDTDLLVNCDFVPDAYVTEEVWVLKDISVKKEDIHIMFIPNGYFSIESKVVELDDDEYIKNFYTINTNYSDIITKHFKKEVIKELQEIAFNYDSNFIESLCNVIKNNYDYNMLQNNLKLIFKEG